MHEAEGLYGFVCCIILDGGAESPSVSSYGSNVLKIEAGTSPSSPSSSSALVSPAGSPVHSVRARACVCVKRESQSPEMRKERTGKFHVGIDAASRPALIDQIALIASSTGCRMKSEDILQD